MAKESRPYKFRRCDVLRFGFVLLRFELVGVEESGIEFGIHFDVGIDFAEDVFAVDVEVDAGGDVAGGKLAVVAEAGVVDFGGVAPPLGF